MKPLGNNAVLAFLGIAMASAAVVGACSGGGVESEEKLERALGDLTKPSLSEPWEKTAVAARTQIARNDEEWDALLDQFGASGQPLSQEIRDPMATLDASSKDLKKLLATPTSVRESRETATAVAKLTATALANLPPTPAPTPTAIPVAVPTPTVPTGATKWVLVETKAAPDVVQGASSAQGLYQVIKSTLGGLSATTAINSGDGTVNANWITTYTFDSPPPNLVPGQTIKLSGSGRSAGEGRMTFGIQTFDLKISARVSRGIDISESTSAGSINTNNGPLNQTVSATIVVPDFAGAGGTFTVHIGLFRCVSDECGVTWIYEAQ